jgi:hypothetical protein
MLFRALAPIVLCVAATWPLRALACVNSMDSSATSFTQPLWLDLLIWTVGAVFLNSVVLENLRDPIAKDQPRPSWFRRSFFLLTGLCLVLLLATALAGGPLLSLSADDLSRCSISRSMLLVLVATPAAFFVLQAMYFQSLGKGAPGRKRSTALVSLVLTSVLLATVMSLTRDVLVLPRLCVIPMDY